MSKQPTTVLASSSLAGGLVNPLEHKKNQRILALDKKIAALRAERERMRGRWVELFCTWDLQTAEEERRDLERNAEKLHKEIRQHNTGLVGIALAQFQQLYSRFEEVQREFLNARSEERALRECITNPRDPKKVRAQLETLFALPHMLAIDVSAERRVFHIYTDMLYARYSRRWMGKWSAGKRWEIGSFCFEFAVSANAVRLTAITNMTDATADGRATPYAAVKGSAVSHCFGDAMHSYIANLLRHGEIPAAFICIVGSIVSIGISAELRGFKKVSGT